MNRRQFTALALAGTLRAQAPDPTVKRVLAFYKCHLDIGFVDTQAAIIQKYFTVHYPRAIELAQSLKKDGMSYTWSTGSWMLYHYLEQASPADRKRMEEAIASGAIAWHALPFTWETELLEPSMINGCLGFSKSLDRRFGRRTTAGKMTDVPGHTRGLIAPLADSGVSFLNIGVNSASTPPDVPELFRWTDPAGKSIVVMYHRLAYGGIIKIPGTDVAVAIEMADDNYGPHKPEEVAAIYADLRKQFPGATIQSASLTDIAEIVVPQKALFPELKQEIGDTWIHGIASDPLKLAQFREIQRERSQWIRRGILKPGDAQDLKFLSKFSLAVEHTWGTDTKTWLDFNHYTPDDLAKMLDDPKYKTVTNSWVEKRVDIQESLDAAPAPARATIKAKVAALKAVRPDLTGLKPHDPAVPFETPAYSIALDPATGAIASLRNKKTGKTWAAPDHPLAVFSYQTFSKQDYDRFLAQYITVQTDWAPKDFGKPNIESFGATSGSWNAKLVRLLAGDDRVVAQLEVPGGPAELYFSLTLPKTPGPIPFELSWFNKRANRMPEALWLSFFPLTGPNPGWQLQKTGGPVSPFDVVPGGNRHMHALTTGLSCRDAESSLQLDTLDAPLVALGEKSPIYFSKDQPDLTKGIHVSLFNNGWGTNYVQWFGEDMRFRFALHV